MTRFTGEYENTFSVPEFFPAFSIVDGPVNAPVNASFTVEGVNPAQIQQHPNEFYFDGGFCRRSGLGPDDFLESAYFTLQPAWKLTREDSKQGVFFGELELVTGAGQACEEPVACKPFTAREEAVHEYASIKQVGKLGFVKPLDPVGIYVDNEGQPVLMTRFEDDLDTLDKIDWREAGRQPSEGARDLFSALGRFALIFGRLHANGFVHRDAQAKNMAISDGGARLLDFVQMRRCIDLENPEAGMVESLEQAMYKDVKTLIESMLLDGLLDGMSPNERGKFLVAALVERYQSVVRHPSSPLNRIEPGLGGAVAATVCGQLVEAMPR